MSNLLNLIGNTAIIKLNRYSGKNVEIFAKLEGINPGGSIKDRIALAMIVDAEKKGLLKNNVQLIEATSGNTGISFAMIAARKKYSFTAIMPRSVSKERRQILKAYGAKLILTDGDKGTDYSYEIAKELLKSETSFLMLDQFKNKNNPNTHYLTTGEEIIRQLPSITHLVAGMGTGGTLTGIGQRLKEYKSSIKIVGVKPTNGKKIQGLRDMNSFIPSVFDQKILDKRVQVSDDVAIKMMKDLAKKEGLFVGMSSGAALWGAIQISKKLQFGNILVIFPDRGEKYLSMKFFK
ncbi:MAG: cysteine synthase [Candidatus Woesebacteria bacterium]|jgi:cysteine synthase